MRLSVAALAAVLNLGLIAAAQAEGPKIFLFDVLKRPAYAAAYRAMLKGQSGLPPWMATVGAALRGTATPGAVVVVDGRPLELYSFCEPHNCAGNDLAVLFEPDGEAAKGLLSVDGRTRFFGAPTPGERKALQSRLGE